MNQTAMLVSIVSVIACLVLAFRSGGIRNLGSDKALRLAAIWAAIIIGLVLIVRYSGIRIVP